MDKEEQNEEEIKEQKEQEAANKTAHVVGKAAATYAGGKLGTEVYNKLSNTKLGQDMEKKIAKNIQKNPQARKAAQKLNDSGVLDAADQGLDISSGQKNNKLDSNKKKPDTPNKTDKPNNINDSSTEEKNKKKKYLMILIILIMSSGMLFFIVLFAVIYQEFGNKTAIGGYYTSRCSEVTVIFTDKQNDYAVTGTQTYPLEDYVAGVVSAEVGGLNNLEVYKTFALAARTYFMTHEGGSCTIESSDRKQVFKDISDKSHPYANLIYQAVEETKGQVILYNGNLESVQYDAFCSIAKDENYYTIKQQNQKIPVSWVDSQRSIIDEWKKGDCSGNHGNGISQWGAYYLATTYDYTYDELLQYYLGDDIMISSKGYLSQVAGLEVKDTTASTPLTQPLGSFLVENGSSIEELNSFIHDSVVENGAGTREGVVTAAVSLINFLYDNFQVKIPYYWGGSYQYYGINQSFGGNAKVSCSNTTCYYYAGFDCSGFVSWAIKNGGYKIGRNTTQGFDEKFSIDSCNITDRNCIGQPGDLINSKTSHVQMIVAVDEESGKYVIAESTSGKEGVVMREWNIHSNHFLKETKILKMDNFYNNSSNVDENY